MLGATRAVARRLEDDADGVADAVPEVLAGCRHGAGTEGHGTHDGATDDCQPALPAAALGEARDPGRQRFVGVILRGRDGGQRRRRGWIRGGGKTGCSGGPGREQRREVGAGRGSRIRDHGAELFQRAPELGRGFEAGVAQHRLDGAILLGVAGAGHDAAWSFSVTSSRRALSPRR